MTYENKHKAAGKEGMSIEEQKHTNMHAEADMAKENAEKQEKLRERAEENKKEETPETNP